MSSGDPLLQPLQGLLNRQLQRSTPARHEAAALDGRTLAIRLRDTALTLYMSVAGGELELAREYRDDPDVILDTTPLGLVELSRGGPGRGRIEMTGDPVVAQHFQALLQHARPDWEEELSRIIGDVAAHQVGNLFRSVLAFGEHAADSMTRNTAEFIREERREVPAPSEVRDFNEQVTAVVEKVDNLTKRFEELARRNP